MHLLDANVFMEASRMYYTFDIAPGTGLFKSMRAAKSLPLRLSSTRSPLALARSLTGRRPSLLRRFGSRTPRTRWS